MNAIWNEEREYKLIEAAQQGDQSAIEELVSSYEPLIHKLASRFRVSAFLHEELIQAGFEGLINAIKKYKPCKDARLSTYAFPWILGEMKHALHHGTSNSSLISLELIDSCCQARDDSLLLRTHSIEDDIDLVFAIEKLKHDDRLLLYWRYTRDLSQKETAMRLKRSQSQISKSERRILDWLKAQLS